MRHEIRLRGRYGDEMRTIVWDDEAGTVEGDHELLVELRAELAADVVTLAFPWGTLDVRGHRHDPADFRAVLFQLLGSFDQVELGSLADVVPTTLPYPAHYEAERVTC